MAAFTRHLGVQVLRMNTADRFLDALAGLHDPEEKRKAVGREFIQVFEEAARTLPNVAWLAEGTIYPDVIESAHAATGKAHVIKSHHNVGGLPERMRLRLIEPLRVLRTRSVRWASISACLRHGLPPPLSWPRARGQDFRGSDRGAREPCGGRIYIFIDELHRQDL